MTDPPAPYVLRGGEAGYKRLLLLSREHWNDTEALLRRAGLQTGMRCVDVGCGGGAVTLEIARWVGPTGSAVGIDMDAVKLDLAAREARERGLANATFRRLRVEEWDEPATYDVAYSRFLLQHLTDPLGLLRRMWASLRTGGRLVVEDVDWEGWSSEPANPGIQFLRDQYIRLLERRGSDPRIGRTLYRRFLELGFPDPEVTLVHPLNLRTEARLLALSTLESISESLQQEGIASAHEIEEARSSLERRVNDPRSLATGPRIFQVVARRP